MPRPKYRITDADFTTALLYLEGKLENTIGGYLWHLGSIENAAHRKRKAISTFLGPLGRISWAHGSLRERRAGTGG